LSSVYGLLSGVNVDITQDANGIITISAATGGGGGGGTNITKVSQLQNDTGFITLASISGGDISIFNNDIGYITANDVTNKQRVLSVGGATITYNSAYEVFKTTYSGGAVTLNAVTALTSQIGNGEVATFEEWITFEGEVTSISQGTNTLIGDWPETIDYTKTHVLVRRLVNNGGTITQYVSYAYNF
jgi:hypothetical protein